ncbi:DUF1761 domain-containing protein [Roseibium sp. RKSG952]|uniref:DUF1761 domain-containing protein n=1 Tax=Roseibium sp. RKSG952 TaxID=2529384 RepID=UPI0012BCB849|nr:DUF1761 domain-containing protein [Roseibium sp. RKSG952]MTI01072.1 DUF1761 domain-containing protein [Roseibium sp. RKSG952]
MMYDGINLLGALGAAVGGFLFGALWYGLLGKAWMQAAGLSAGQSRPSPGIMALTFLCQFIMAFVFAGVIYHVAGTSVRSGLISAAMIWIGFMLPAQIVNHRFQGKPWSLTAIDSGHWLGVLLVQGILIGLIDDFPA